MTAEDWRPAAGLAVLHARAGMLARIRARFARAGVPEVETPVLSAAAVSDVHLESIPVDAAGRGRMYLQTSPEYAMKRLLACGFGDCYQVARVFRDGESGRFHNPEFTLIEWYRLGFDAARLMDEVEDVLREALSGIRVLGPAERLTYRDAVRSLAGVDPMTADEAGLRDALARHGVEPAAAGSCDRDALLDLLVATVVGPRLGSDRPCFIHDYPASQAALARVREERYPVAERFELYLDGVELANGFHELADAAEQRRRFGADLATRRARGQPLRPLDERFLASLEHGLPDCAGVALGFDRLVMAGLSLESLAEAMAFPIERA